MVLKVYFLGIRFLKGAERIRVQFLLLDKGAVFEEVYSLIDTVLVGTVLEAV